eukprot:9034382-Ditylum_brightwellii.AAC.1
MILQPAPEPEDEPELPVDAIPPPEVVPLPHSLQCHNGIPPIQTPEDSDDSNLCTETIVKLTDEKGQWAQILALLDTGAIGKVGAF